MRPDLMGDVGATLMALGVGLQWLRAQKGVSEWWTTSLGVLLAIGIWTLAVDWHAVKDYPAFIFHNVTSIITLVGALFGGTFTGSSVAKGIVAANPDAASNPFVPLTNSK